jgi:hypothetical protein
MTPVQVASKDRCVIEITEYDSGQSILHLTELRNVTSLIIMMLTLVVNNLPLSKLLIAAR